MIKRILVLQFTLFVVASSLAQKKNDDQVIVFSVNDKPVTSKEFIYLYQKNHQNKPDEFTKEKIEEYLDLFVNFKLKVTEAQARGIDTTEAFRKEFNSYKDELRKPYLPDSRLLDSLVRLTYERMQEEVNASHILITIKGEGLPADTMEAYQKITEIRKRALDGEDFATLAQTFSEEPSAKVTRGNLGYFTALQMVYPFENAAYTTKPGSISEPLRTRFGYHILKVNDRRPSSGEVEVSHILIRTGENKDNAKSKDTAFDIYDQLQHGGSWNELCKQYSEDPSSKENGGKLRPFGVGYMSAVPKFEEVAFSLTNPGDVSDPFETQYGWHIVKLERKIPLLPFKDVESILKNKVSRDDRVQISKQALYEKLKNDHSFSQDLEVRKKVLALADSSLSKGKWNPEIGSIANATLFGLSGSAYRVKDFIDRIIKTQRPNRLAPQKYLEQQLDAYIENELLNIVEKNIVAQNPEFKWLLNEYYEGILLFDIMEDEVWNKASEDSVGQLRYFEKNASKYAAGERIDAVIYSSTTQQHVESLKSAVESKDSIKAAGIVTDLKIRKESGAFEKADRQVLNKIDWKPGVHFSENNDLHYLVVIRKMLPPGLKTFDEARPEVISDYQNYLEKEWVSALKKKHKVKINKKGVEFVVNKLIAQQASLNK
ncbi:MAG TPA: peptidylprolyl isomerase [Chryseosolibacter sp.]|nr:peptidylprolyl isomerase [Chryseosolibacter sp.]